MSTLFSCAGSALGFSISSEEHYVTREAGVSVTLSCNYSLSSSSPYLFWYRQYPQKIQFILLRGGKGLANVFNLNKDLAEGKFSSETSHTSTNLTISSLTESDSALYLCALSDGAQCCRSIKRMLKTVCTVAHIHQVVQFN